MPLTFAEFLRGVAPASKTLHLTHCTGMMPAIAALERLALVPTACPVYGEDLLYLFYGRPAYKPLSLEEAGDMPELLPVCFVLDPSVLASVERVVPFDSGGFSRYRRHLGAAPRLEQFEVLDDPTAPARVVGAFYGTNRRYFDQRPSKGVDDFPASRPSARAYARLIADRSLEHDDDRRGAIEVQLARDVPLAEALRAVVAPPLMFEDPIVLEALAACPDAAMVSYPTYGRHRPQDYSLLVYDRVDAFLGLQRAFE